MVPGCAPANALSARNTQGSSWDDGEQPQTLLTTDLFAFDTFITLSADCSQTVMTALEERSRFFESAFSRTIPSSDIARINDAQGAPVTVHPETADIITRSIAYSGITNGLFDITIGAVSALWDFKQGIVPPEESIREAVSHIGYERISMEGNTVRLTDPYAQIDLGGIAKGYIADDLARQLEAQGCTSACLDLGGTVRTIGCRPDGNPWRIGIQDPHHHDALVRTVEARNRSVVTSALTERCFEQEGRQYWHILDPRTGYPVSGKVTSVSILGPQATDGEAFAKPLFMTGAEEAPEWTRVHDQLEVLLIDETGKIWEMRPGSAA